MKAGIWSMTGADKQRAWFYDDPTENIFNGNNQWIEVDQNSVNKAFEDKADIDMPNVSTIGLNPRQTFLLAISL
jgi:hypothetical protein